MSASSLPRIFFYLLLNVIVFAVIIITLIYTDILKASDFTDILNTQEEETIDEYDYLLENLRIEKKSEAIQNRFDKLKYERESFEKEKQSFIIKAAEFEKNKEEYNEQKKILEDQLNNYTNKKDGFKDISDTLSKMAPEKAAEILEGQDDQYIIDLFRVTDEEAQKNSSNSLVPTWLGLMSTEKAIDIQRKMLLKPKAEEK